MNENNFHQALNLVDYLVVADASLDQNAINRLARSMKVPRQEFQKILQGALGNLQVVTSHWVLDCVEDSKILDGQDYQLDMNL